MKIPKDRNTRAEAMWRIISQKVDFRGKRVIDLGCGTGDFLWRAYVAGAKEVVGVDTEIKTNIDALYNEIIVARDDISRIVNSLGAYVQVNDEQPYFYNRSDIAFCFSVLPYLDDIPATLKWMAKNFSICLIECQYNGDGPGLPNIGGDRGMMQYLLNEGGFSHAIPIGKTRVEGRKYPDGNSVSRTIWTASVVASDD